MTKPGIETHSTPLPSTAAARSAAWSIAARHWWRVPLGQPACEFGDQLRIAVVGEWRLAVRSVAGFRCGVGGVVLAGPATDIFGPVAGTARPSFGVQGLRLAAARQHRVCAAGRPPQSSVEGERRGVTQAAGRFGGLDLSQRAQCWTAGGDNIALGQTEGMAPAANGLAQPLQCRRLRSVHAADAIQPRF